MDDDFDDWLAVKTPLCERPFPILLGKTESLTREEFSDLSDCYMYSVRHGWTGWEQKHGKTPTHPTGDQVASIPPVGVIMTILDFRIAGFKREELPQPPAYWHRLTRLATTRLLGGLPLD